LADGHDVGPAADLAQHVDQRVDVVVQVEAALENGHVARIDPVGDVDIVVGEKGAHRPAKQRGVVAGQGRDHEHRRGVGRSARLDQAFGIAAEAPQFHPRRAPDRLAPHGHRPAVHHHLVDVPGRLEVAAGQVGGDVGRRRQRAAELGGGGGVERRTPEITRQFGGDTKRGGGAVGGFV